MEYTKLFEDTFSGRNYFVSECCMDDGTLRHLVLCEVDGTNVVEVDNHYKGTTVKKVGYILGNLIEINIEDFDKRFVEIKVIND